MTSGCSPNPSSRERRLTRPNTLQSSCNWVESLFHDGSTGSQARNGHRRSGTAFPQCAQKSRPRKSTTRGRDGRRVQALETRGRLGAGGRIREEPRLAAHCDWADGVFAKIVVDLERPSARTRTRLAHW